MTVEKALTEHLNSLSDEQKKIHRVAFHHFLKCLVAESVTAKCHDGRTFDGIFNTATPFVGRDFRLCLKRTSAKVRSAFSAFHSISLMLTPPPMSLLLDPAMCASLLMLLLSVHLLCAKGFANLPFFFDLPYLLTLQNPFTPRMRKAMSSMTPT